MSNLTLYVGDIHGDFQALRAVVDAVLGRLASVERVIQVGDFGFWPRHDPDFGLLSISVPLLFIDGNHEDHPSLQSARLDAPGRVLADCPALLIPRGYVADGVVFMGGGTSIDRSSRLEGEDWFREENLIEAEVARAIGRVRESPVKVMVAHETTAGAFHCIRRLDWAPVDRNRDLLEELFLAARPLVYVHGHYHFFREYEYLGCRFFSLANPDAFRRELESGDGDAILGVARECAVAVDAEGQVHPF